MASGANLAQAWFSIAWIVSVVVVLGILFVLASWMRRRRETGTVFSAASPQMTTEEYPEHEKDCEVYVPLGPSGRSDRDADVHVPCDVPHSTDM